MNLILWWNITEISSKKEKNTAKMENRTECKNSLDFWRAIFWTAYRQQTRKKVGVIQAIQLLHCVSKPKVGLVQVPPSSVSTVPIFNFMEPQFCGTVKCSKFGEIVACANRGLRGDQELVQPFNMHSLNLGLTTVGKLIISKLNQIRCFIVKSKKVFSKKTCWKLLLFCDCN